MHVLLVGAGYMSTEYVKILDVLNVEYTIVGRGEKSASIFEKQFGKKVIPGGLEVAYDFLPVQPTHVIVATTLESLEENTLFLLRKGIQNILVEKPGAVNVEGMNRISELAEKKSANVFIAYNRRFYSSVMTAQRMIEEDGGLSSFLFEFTEWTHNVKGFNKTPFQLDNWFIGNSTHVVDTAFFFGGKPKEISSFVTSHLDWHKKGSIYAGSGITDKNILFSYHANWQAPGSWKLELLTNKNRYIFRPFEKLHVQQLKSMAIEKVDINDELDIQFKPGLFEQTRSFLFNTDFKPRLLAAKKAAEMMVIYEKMNGERK
jgi:predicted dehydrogenase